MSRRRLIDISVFLVSVLSFVVHHHTDTGLFVPGEARQQAYDSVSDVYARVRQVLFSSLFLLFLFSFSFFVSSFHSFVLSF
jgi:hypothetical protein